MRKLGVIAGLLALVLMGTGAATAMTSKGNCTMTVCGAKCLVWGDFGGYCNPPADPTVGCIQLFGPDCASMDGAACCQAPPTGAF